MSEGLLQRLEKGFVLGDGGYLMALRMRGFVRTGAMTPQVVATHPEEVRKLTKEFRDAGAEVLQTLTFFGTSNMLKPAGHSRDRAKEINTTACRIAKEVAGDDALVAGNLNSPTITCMDYDPSDAEKRDRTRAWLDEQLPWICDGGVDFLILETFSWLDEALLALDVARGNGTPAGGYGEHGGKGKRGDVRRVFAGGMRQTTGGCRRRRGRIELHLPARGNARLRNPYAAGCRYPCVLPAFRLAFLVGPARGHEMRSSPGSQ